MDENKIFPDMTCVIGLTREQLKYCKYQKITIQIIKKNAVAKN